LLPAYKETKINHVGRVFSKPLNIKEDVPDEIKAICENVDNQNRNLSVFAAEVFDKALHYGLTHILVDKPPAAGETLADSNEPPYMAHISPRNVLGWKHSNGMLTQLRIKDSITVDDGEFGSKSVEVISVLEPTRWRKFVKGADGEYQIMENGEGINTLGVIPLVTIYTGRTGFMTAEPPLKELAHLNVKHWQSQSDQDKLLHTARVPLLACFSGDEIKLIEAGASVIHLPPDADLRYVEHTGAAISSGRDSLKDLIEDMRLAGAKLLQTDTSFKTATQARDDGVTNKSALARMADNLRDGIDAALQYMADWMDVDDGGSVDLNTDLDNDLAPLESMGVVNQMVVAGTLSHKTAFGESKRRGIIDESINWEDEQELIKNESAKVDGQY
jgi:hypothetical protein